jgi:hypothetical protein
MCRSILGDIVGKATCANCTRQMASKEKTRAGGAESDRIDDVGKSRGRRKSSRGGNSGAWSVLRTSGESSAPRSR